MARRALLLLFSLLLSFPSRSLQESPASSDPPLPSAAAHPPLPPYPSAPYALASALFVIGDSTVDCGTNNLLVTLTRADHPPYGRDFDTHRPMGRFSDGRTVVDYLALRLGLPFVPPFLGHSGQIEEMIRGVNYASAASGIIFSSGDDLGQHVPLSQQIRQMMETFQDFQLRLGQQAAADMIQRSVFYVSIGSNDIHYYLQNVSGVQLTHSPRVFNNLLTDTVNKAIKTLYDANARKVVVMGLAPIGCAPYYLFLSGTRNGKCVESVNNVVIKFNSAMREMVDKLNHELPGSMITFCDAFNGTLDILANQHQYGFLTTTEACCGMGLYRGMMCLTPDMACKDASTHVWWDEFHPTDAANRILADDVWSGMHTSMCHPMNLEDMVRLDQ